MTPNPGGSWCFVDLNRIVGSLGKYKPRSQLVTKIKWPLSVTS